jgi:hypothetical protein
MPFAVLSCNTDIKNVRIEHDFEVNDDMVNTHIKEFKQIHNFIDDYHDITKRALTEDVVVDTRMGRGDYGLYHEPLEQVLLYLGLSLTKDQTVNTSIDGKSITRALIPAHPTNANLWYELFQRAPEVHVPKLPASWGCVDPSQKKSSGNQTYEPVFTIKKKKKKKRR